MSETAKERSGRVWDPLVRIFHWTLAAAVATAWFETSEASIHQTAGKVVLVLIILRTAWGIIGTGSARFETFIKGPLTTLRYVISIVRGKPAHHLGHNPAGAAMIGALLLSLVTTTVSGILMTTTALWGSPWLGWVHGTAATLTIFLVAGHLLGVLAACIQHRENLPWSMVTGRKTVSVNTERFLGPTMFTRWRNLAALAIVAAGFGVWNASNAALNASFWRMPKMIASGAEKIGCEAENVGSPRLVVYPALELQYDVAFAGGAGRSMATIPASVALERRPKIEFPAMQEDCGVVVQAQYLQEYGAPLQDVAGLFSSITQSTVASAAQVAALPMSATAVWTEPSALLATEESAPVADAPMKPTRIVKGEPSNKQVQGRTSRPKKQAVLQPAKKKPVAKVRKAQVAKAKPAKRKAKKPLRILRPSSVRTPSSRQLLSQSERRDDSGSGSSSSGSGSDDDNDDLDSDNGGSGSGNSGSDSSNSGSGGGDD